MAQQIVPIRFTFVRLPVSWKVLSGEQLRGLLAAQFKAHATKHGKKLSSDKLRDLMKGSTPAGPVLYGQLKETESAQSGVLREINGWHWRHEFFSLPADDLDRLVAFLNEVGAWPSSGDPNPYTPGHALMFPAIVQPEDVWSFRDDLKDALLDGNRKWFKETVTPIISKPKTWLDLYSHQPANNFPLHFELTKVPGGVVTLTNARHMLFATVLADVARGIRFKTCKRRDCRKPFPIETKHKHDYCEPYCGHLVSLRKKRDEEKKQRRAEERKRARKSLR